MAKKLEQNGLIYQAKSGAIELKGDFSNETIWANQAQIASVFGVERSVVTKHIRNILKDKELDQKAVCAKFAHTANDGKVYQIQTYNLDVILSVGYRTNSKRAMEFRRWATKTLREHITEGFTVNRSRIKYNYERFLNVAQDIQKLLPVSSAVNPSDAVELISRK